MGGVGKTTLALMVYNDEETAKKFSLKAWVCVSNQYDMVRITKTILEAVTSHSNCWLVFEKHAFQNRSINLHPSLVLIGKKIVEKCAGLPIIPALRLSYNHLPSHLKRCFAYCAIFPKNYEFMVKELILLWMAEGLIQCSQDINKQEMEDLGHDYFREMLSMSFFQPSNRNISRFVMHDFIHDLAQFVAGEICFHLEDRLGIDCSISEKIRFSSFIRCYFDVFNKFEFFHKVGHLHTFIALPVCSSPFLPHYLSNKMLHELVPKLVTLRVILLGFGKLKNAKNANLHLKHILEWLTVKWSAKLDDSRNKMHEMDVLNSLQPHLNLKKLSIMEYGGLKLPCWIGDSSFCKMVDVTLINCRKCISLPCLGQLPLLKNLRIEGMEEVKKVGVEFLGGPSLSIKAFPSLESLSFVNMPKWVNWEHRFNRLHQGLMAFLPALEVLRISECGELTYLSDGSKNLLEIMDCPQLVSLEDDEEQGLPHSLQYLEIGKCDNLEKLPNGLQNLTSLEELSIWACPKLVSFPKIDFLSMLRRLIIRDCEDLKSLPDGMMRNCNKNSSLCLLEYLEISFCPSLRCFPEGELPTTLKELHICYCKNLESLPDGVMKHDSSPQHNTSGLQVLQIWRCSSLKSFPRGCFPPTLKLLQIWSCSQLELMIEKMFHDDNSLECLDVNVNSNLKSLPDCLYNLRRLQIKRCMNLKSLPHQMRNLTSLMSLEIADCGNIQTSLSKWGLSRLTSLKSFSIAGIFPEVVSFSNDPDPFLLPSTLTYLSIERFKNLESLTSLALHTLTSLQHLWISGCPKLQSFLSREGLSDTVSQLYIRDCPLLSQRCIKEKGEDWPMISHIPYVEINRKFIFEQ
ncbi:unnamed protein product, partial [Vitis vinifera]